MRPLRRWRALIVVTIVVLGPMTEARAALYSATFDTSALSGTAASLEFSLFDLDLVDGNNTVTLSGPLFAAPDTLSDAGGFEQRLVDHTLGSSLIFDVDFTTNSTDAPADRFIFSVLDPLTSFTLFDTDLENDALLIIDLIGDGEIQAATTLTPIGQPGNGAPAVPEPATLMLVMLGAPVAWAVQRQRRLTGSMR
jgi:hypothetical protein